VLWNDKLSKNQCWTYISCASSPLSLAAIAHYHIMSLHSTINVFHDYHISLECHVSVRCLFFSFYIFLARWKVCMPILIVEESVVNGACCCWGEEEDEKEKQHGSGTPLPLLWHLTPSSSQFYAQLLVFRYWCYVNLFVKI